MRDVQADINIAGYGTFVVGGVDISKHVRSATFRIEVGQVTRVEFEVVGDVALDVKAAEVTMERKA